MKLLYRRLFFFGIAAGYILLLAPLVFDPSPHYFWGLSILVYAPVQSAVIAVLAASLALFVFFRGFPSDSLLSALHKLPSGTVYTMPFIAGLLFYFFRQKTFLLGDGVLRLTNTATGHLYSFEEPLDTFLHTTLFNILNPLYGIDAHSVYLWLSVAAGVFAVTSALYYIPRIFDKTGEQWFAGLLVFSSGTVQLFFGYVESYSLAASLILVYLLSALYMMKLKKTSVVPSVFLGLAMVTHPVSAMFFPSALYAYFSILHGNRTEKNALVVMYSALTFVFMGTGLIILFMIGGGMTPADFIHHYLNGGNKLPLVSGESGYSILSPHHFIDILNEFFLIAPYFIAGIAVLPLVNDQRKTANTRFLLTAFSGILFFALAFNPKLGYARDWDIFSLAAWPLALLVASTMIYGIKEKLSTFAFPLLVLSMTATSSWIAVNASESQSVKRFESLADTSWWSNFAQGQAHEVIGSYYFDKDDLDAFARHNKTAYELTSNPRYFGNVVRMYEYLGNLDALRNFACIAPDNAEGHFSLGSLLLRQQRYSEALVELEKAAEIEPDIKNIHYKLGIVYCATGRFEDAVRENLAALGNQANEEYKPNILNNLGIAYLKIRDIKNSEKTFLQLAELKDEDPDVYLNLAYISLLQGDKEEAVERVETAERLGCEPERLNSFLDSIGQGEETLKF